MIRHFTHYSQVLKDTYYPGDLFSTTVQVCNPQLEPLESHPLFVILDVYDTLYFAPDFSDFNSVNQDYPPGETEVTILDPFLWPEDVGSATGLSWYAALVDPSVSNLVSNLSTWEFGWSN